ncbi:MAG: type II secretory pathway pseudopilin PulG [Planctomycetota bacterium]|jgi:type II secretory pathway pseudopilin PulG
MKTQLNRAQARKSSESGMTLIEVIIVSALMVAASGTFMLVANGASGLAEQSIEATQLHQRSTSALARIVGALRTGSLSSFQPALDPELPIFTSDLTSMLVTGTDIDGASLGSPVRIWSELDPLELDDAIDNDGDGLIDERQVSLTVDSGLAGERTIVIAKNVAEYSGGETANGIDDNGNDLADERGLAFWLTDSVLHVRLTVEHQTTRGDVLQVTRESSINIKNQ